MSKTLEVEVMTYKKVSVTRENITHAQLLQAEWEKYMKEHNGHLVADWYEGLSRCVSVWLCKRDNQRQWIPNWEIWSKWEPSVV